MKNDVLSWVTLAYLSAILLFGGASAAGLGANMLLQVGGAALITWVLWHEKPSDGIVTGLKAFLLALLAVALIQFLPLPPIVWQHLPGRDAIARGYDLAGVARPWLTLSLDPWRSLQSLVWCIPALGMVVVARSARAPKPRHMIGLIAAIAYASIILAIVQTYSGSGYFYLITNLGNGVGLFANSNHFGSFMLIALALVAGQWIHDKPALMRTNPKSASGYVLIARLAPFVLGIFLSNSLACAILICPVLAGIWMLYGPQTKVRWPFVALGLPLVAVPMVWLLSSGVVSNDLMAKSGTVGISRGEFLANGLEMVRSFAPLGSGIGTFPEIYPWFEELAVVGTTFVNHAHNDLLELAIETGLPGLVVLGLFLRWYGVRLRDLWANERERNPVAIAAALGIGAVLIHSLADYPLRTAAIGGLFGLCAVIMSRPPEIRGSAAGAKVDTRRDELLHI